MRPLQGIHVPQRSLPKESIKDKKEILSVIPDDYKEKISPISNPPIIKTFIIYKFTEGVTITCDMNDLLEEILILKNLTQNSAKVYTRLVWTPSSAINNKSTTQQRFNLLERSLRLMSNTKVKDIFNLYHEEDDKLIIIKGSFSGVVTGSIDGTVKIWENVQENKTFMFELKKSIDQHDGSSTKISSNGLVWWTCCGCAALIVTDLSINNHYVNIAMFDNKDKAAFTYMGLSICCNILVVARKDNRIQILKADTLEVMNTFNIPQNSFYFLTRVAISDDLRFLVASNPHENGVFEKLIRWELNWTWNSVTGRPLSVTSIKKEEIILPDSGRMPPRDLVFISGTDDLLISLHSSKVRLWAGGNPKDTELIQFNPNKGAVFCHSPRESDIPWFVVVTASGYIEIWFMNHCDGKYTLRANDKALTELPDREIKVEVCTVSPSGDTLVIGLKNGDILVYLNVIEKIIKNVISTPSGSVLDIATVCPFKILSPGGLSNTGKEHCDGKSSYAPIILLKDNIGHRSSIFSADICGELSELYI